MWQRTRRRSVSSACLAARAGARMSPRSRRHGRPSLLVRAVRARLADLALPPGRTTHAVGARICTGTGLTPAHICAGTGLTPCHICAGTGLTHAHICTRTGLAPAHICAGTGPTTCHICAGTPAFSPELTGPHLRRSSLAPIYAAVAALVSAINYAALHRATSSVQHTDPRGRMGGDDCSSRRSSRGACCWHTRSPRASAGRALWQQQNNKRDTRPPRPLRGTTGHCEYCE